ncbi:MAG TPA: hypothetical protein VMC06_13655, partial [Opitutaceae bacterium]|nr:hypothetical protein [Opitutaceae bacterium]
MAIRSHAAAFGERLLRGVFRVAPALLLIPWLSPAKLLATGNREAAIRVGPGPQLFIDDDLIGEQSFLTRTVNRPAKLAEPVITGRAGGDDNFQPYLTVLRD